VDARRRPRAWEYAVGAGVGWDSNIPFLGPDGPSDVMLIPRGGLTRTFSSPHGELRATAAGRFSGYPHHEDLRRYYADASLEGSYRSSPATEWRGSAAYELGDSFSSFILLEQGAALPRVKTRSMSGTVGLTRQTGKRTTLRLDGRFYRTEFDAATLINGDSVRGSLALERQVGKRTAAALRYTVEDVLSDEANRAYLTHFASVQWTRVLSPRSAVMAEAGSSFTPDAERAGLQHSQSFFGGASLSRHVKRSGVTLFVRREVMPAFGIGLSRLELRAGLGATVPFGRAWELQASATHVQPERSRVAPRADAVADDAYLVIGRRLRGQLGISAEAKYRRRGQTSGLPTADTFQAGLFLTLLSPAGRAPEDR